MEPLASESKVSPICEPVVFVPVVRRVLRKRRRYKFKNPYHK